MNRRRFLQAAGMGALAAPSINILAARAATVGITKSEIKFGNINALSGPASAYGAITRGHVAFWKMVNAGGGINGRKVNFLYYDDGYSPPRTVEQARRLVEQDRVAFIFNPLGTPTNSAIQRYMNQRKVPQLYVSTGASKFGDYKHFPWTIGWQPSYPTEAAIYAEHLKTTKPNAMIAVLYQNDDFGKDYVDGLKTFYGKDYHRHVIKEASYETTDATLDSQVVALKDSGADALIVAAIPKFAAQSIAKVYDIGWKPTFYMTNVSISVGAVMKPAGLQKGVGIMTALYQKDPTDPAWNNDAGMNQWRGFVKQWEPAIDTTDNNFVFSYGVCTTMLQALKQCGNDLSRENIMRQATSIQHETVPTLLPGIEVNISATNYYPIRQMQLARWDGKTWGRFGSILGHAGA